MRIGGRRRRVRRGMGCARRGSQRMRLALEIILFRFEFIERLGYALQKKQSRTMRRNGFFAVGYELRRSLHGGLDFRNNRRWFLSELSANAVTKSYTGAYSMSTSTSVSTMTTTSSGCVSIMSITYSFPKCSIVIESPFDNTEKFFNLISKLHSYSHFRTATWLLGC